MGSPPRRTRYTFVLPWVRISRRVCSPTSISRFTLSPLIRPPPKPRVNKIPTLLMGTDRSAVPTYFAALTVASLAAWTGASRRKGNLHSKCEKRGAPTSSRGTARRSTALPSACCICTIQMGCSTNTLDYERPRYGGRRRAEAVTYRLHAHVANRAQALTGIKVENRAAWPSPRRVTATVNGHIHVRERSRASGLSRLSCACVGPALRPNCPTLCPHARETRTPCFTC